MQYCEHCGSELPVRAHFCGNCGKVLSDVTRGEGQLSRQFTPFPPSEERQTDENRPVFPDVMLPFTPLGYGQLPGGTVPAVQGTPQIGGVPSVQGTPSAGMPLDSAGAPPAHGLAHHGAMSAPQHTWSWEQPQQHHVELAQPTPPHTHPPVHHQHQPAQTRPLEHHQQHHRDQHHQQHVKPHRVHRLRLPHVAKAGATTTKLAAGVATKWGIVLLTAAVVLAASGVLFVVANSPALSLSGASTITAGGILHIHGKGFVPGGSVALTLDNGSPVTTIGPQAKKVASIGAGPAVADASQLLTTTQAEKLATPNSTMRVGITGTFDADIATLTSWSAGKHVIHATEGLGSRSASLPFTILAIRAHLVVNPATLDFGMVPMGRKVVKSVLIGNTGGSPLTWNAATNGSQWLKLGNGSSVGVGIVEPNGAQEALYVTVDASHLKIGDYSATIQIHAKNSGGDVQVAVQVHVGPASKVQQAQLSVNPTKLDFGKLPAGQQVINNITIANQGTAALKWQAGTGTASWLALSTTSGNVSAGGLPEIVQVVADPSNSSLQPGLNSATITIGSNGGTTTIPVTLTLNSSPPPGGSPTPTPTPTIPPPILAGNPGGFAVPGDPNCTYSASQGWTCTATLSSFASAQTNLSWTATSSGISGVSFNPSSGVLAPGQQNVPVSISIPNTVCPASATFTFNGPANSVPIAWSCAAPTLNVNTSSINANTDCQFNNGWTCSVSLSTGASDQGQLSWTATSSGGIGGITFTPPSGTLTAGQSTTVSITVPGTNCPNSATLTFNGMNVSWSCGTAMLKVSPSAYTIPDNNCTYGPGQGWSCTATLSLTSPGDPATTWSSFSQSGGVQFSPASGTLKPGQPTTVTITIPDTTCPASISLMFLLSGSNTVTVPWNCNAPPLSVNVTSVGGNCTTNPDGSFTCNVTVSIPSSSQGSVSWSASASSNLPGVVFTPPGGPLSGANSSTPVSINIPASDCQAGTVTFSEQGGNSVTVTWTCKQTAILSADNTTFNANNCPFSSSAGAYVCTVKLSSSATLNWYATTDMPTAISFSPSGGPVSPGSPVAVTIYVALGCPSSASISFVGPNNTVQASWNC